MRIELYNICLSKESCPKTFSRFLCENTSRKFTIESFEQTTTVWLSSPVAVLLLARLLYTYKSRGTFHGDGPRGTGVWIKLYRWWTTKEVCRRRSGGCRGGGSLTAASVWSSDARLFPLGRDSRQWENTTPRHPDTPTLRRSGTIHMEYTIMLSGFIN